MTNEPLFSDLGEIISYFKASVRSEVRFRVSYPDFERFGIKSFVDMAECFAYRFHMPQPLEDSLVLLRFFALQKENSFHAQKAIDAKYGAQSEFATLDKASKFSFLYHLQEALWHVDFEKKRRILDLGINQGDEFGILQKMLTPDEFKQKEFVGIDYVHSAIEAAKLKFPHVNVHFYTHDIQELRSLWLGRFDMLLSIATLQSGAMNFKEMLMQIYKEHLTPDASIVLGFANCRWVDGEMLYGARAKHYNFSELGVVLGDIDFAKRYLQQKGYRVMITGKEYLFLAARKIGGANG